MVSNVDLLRRLARSGFEHVLVGGMAGVVHGSSFVTRDIDVCAPFTELNFVRLVAALSGLDASHRLRPLQPPMCESAVELAAASELSLSTSLGPLDIIPDVAGLGSWPAVLAAAEIVDVEPGLGCRVLSLDALIASKRALGRTRDLLAVEELEEIRRRTRQP
jgi:hypothetical protein